MRKIEGQGEGDERQDNCTERVHGLRMIPKVTLNLLTCSLQHAF